MVRLLYLWMLALITASSAFASGTIGYGSRAGMEVDVVKMQGLDTSKAIIVTKHSRENATTFCREYVQKVTEDCIRQELSVPMNDTISADCKKGIFTDFFGAKYQFIGPNRSPSISAKYRIKDLTTGEIADGSMASGYPVVSQIFKALCPRTAPMDIGE